MSPTATNENGSSANGARAKLDDKAAPYQGEQPYGMPNDLVIPSIMDIDGTDERLWVLETTTRTVHQETPTNVCAGPTSTRRLLPTTAPQHIARLLRQHPPG